MISFGALAAFSFVNLAVVKTYIFDRGQRTGADIIKYGVLPFLGMAFTLYLWTQLSGLTFQIGLGWLAGGFIALLIITRLFRVDPPPMYTGEEEELERA
jgi:putrescine importer